jgi:hypothetical protein
MVTVSDVLQFPLTALAGAVACDFEGKGVKR